MNEPYPGWLEAFEHQRGLSRRRHEETGTEPIPDETWERWKKEILDELEERQCKKPHE